MKIRHWATGLAVLAMAVGCSSAPQPVPVMGGAADLSQLTGEWTGEYHSLAGGRRGTIAFNLSAGADSATGDVLMFPMQHNPPADGETRTEPSPPHLPQSLSISFVRAANGVVSGRLDPYQDPECDCQVFTIFEGRLQGDAISGTYVAHRTGAASMSGEWKVTRKKP